MRKHVEFLRAIWVLFGLMMAIPGLIVMSSSAYPVSWRFIAAGAGVVFWLLFRFSWRFASQAILAEAKEKRARASQLRVSRRLQETLKLFQQDEARALKKGVAAHFVRR